MVSFRPLCKATALVTGWIFCGIDYSSAQSFSCTFGRAACLDYGDKVCSSFSKCVSDDAVCFDSYTCDYSGFICKSKYDELSDEAQEISDKYNSLISDYNEFLKKRKTLIVRYEELSSDHEQLSSNHRELKDCVDSASSLIEAQGCI